MRRIAVLTSGGDSPGMNAALRAVVRSSIASGYEAFGVQNGYAGLAASKFVALGPRSVGGIIHLGGTMLGTSRYPELMTPAGQRRAIQALERQDIAALFVIGGNGSQAGAHALSAAGASIVGIASTIDNDLFGTDVSIGATTALDIALESIDRLRVTAASHRRVFLVEVMGRASGYLALMAGIAGGAEVIVLPEIDTSPEAVAMQLRACHERGKSHAICVVAEGAKFNAEALAEYFRVHDERLGFDLRVTKLGHVQRGGHPGVFDRVLATQLGAAAVEFFNEGRAGIVVGRIGSDVIGTPLVEAAREKKPLDKRLFELATTLSQ